MYEFLVLGIIPGTNAQITFTTWLLAADLLALAFVLRAAHRRHMLRNGLVSLGLYALLQLGLFGHNTLRIQL